jgi:hypothetical protein
VPDRSGDLARVDMTSELYPREIGAGDGMGILHALPSLAHQSGEKLIDIAATLDVRSSKYAPEVVGTMDGDVLPVVHDSQPTRPPRPRCGGDSPAALLQGPPGGELATV